MKVSGSVNKPRSGEVRASANPATSFFGQRNVCSEGSSGNSLAAISMALRRPSFIHSLDGFFDCLNKFRHILSAQILGPDLKLIAALSLKLELQRRFPLNIGFEHTDQSGDGSARAYCFDQDLADDFEVAFCSRFGGFQGGRCGDARLIAEVAAQLSCQVLQGFVIEIN
jgi:hypothetical protein